MNKDMTRQELRKKVGTMQQDGIAMTWAARFLWERHGMDLDTAYHYAPAMVIAMDALAIKYME